MPLAEPVGGSVIARVLISALKWAKSRKSPDISESQLVQIAKVTVLGSNSSVNISGPVTRESAEELDNVIARCFDAAMRQPGLRIKYTLGIDGERTISVENIETYRIPAAADIESYIIAEARRGIQQPKPGQSAIGLPPPT